MGDMDLEVVKAEVRKNMALLNVAELTTLASELSVTVPPAKMGKLSGIFKGSRSLYFDIFDPLNQQVKHHQFIPPLFVVD